jgi:hypothetical protein
MGIAGALNLLGLVARARGDQGAARARYEECLATHRERGDKKGIAQSLIHLGSTLRAQGDIAAARALFEEGLAIYRELGSGRGIAFFLETFASGTVDEEGGAERSVRLWGAAAALRDALGGNRVYPLDREKREHELAAVRASLGEAAFAAAWGVGRAMTWEQAVACALGEAPEGEIRG